MIVNRFVIRILIQMYYYEGPQQKHLPNPLTFPSYRHDSNPANTYNIMTNRFGNGARIQAVT